MTNSIITHLAIYRQGCFVKREGTIKVSKGRQYIILDEIPNSLDTKTLSVSLSNKIKGSNVQIEALEEERIEEITKELNTKINKIDKLITIKNNQIELWNKNSDFSSKESVSISDITQYIDKLPERLENIYEEIEKLLEDKKELEKKLEDKQKETNVYQIKIDIEANEDGEYPFELRYKDDLAYWYPTYEIHTTDNNELSLLLNARIKQYTNHDIKDTKISLFSGNPSMSSEIPELYPNNIHFYENIRYAAAGRANMKMSMDAAIAEEAVAYEDSMVEVSNVSASSNKEDTMMEYELDGLWSLDSDKEISVLIDEKKIECKYHVIAIPKVDDCAYLAAKVNTVDIEDLIHTNAVIYHKGTYIGEVYLDPDFNKDEYDISLGRDESIKLKRTQKKKYTSNVLLKNQKKTEYEYEIKITSSKNDRCLISLYDQIPVSQDKSIVVELIDSCKATLEEDTGKLLWQFELEPQESKTFTLAYSISWPKDKRINI